ncbi:hypothetical protein TSUD_378530 [Trifolium subterraneum]|uniref:Pentacotripeptide-repeat region of PRORP domain-containing protein n=1 Tax=Trifolium subterraneum TaxID=3900 RepID=A0A2Z6P8N6_TRISU|nr:hypothetical protein TSUD_378530 [Trifolium subterraneum]
MINPRTAPFVLRYLRDRVQHVRDNGVIIYNVTLKVFRKCKDFEGAQKVFDEMLQRGVKPDNITFTTMINCARMSSLSDKAVEWFEKMPGFGCEPDAITCSAMELNAPFVKVPNEAGWFLVSKEAAKQWLESRDSTKSVAALDSLVERVPSMSLPY